MKVPTSYTLRISRKTLVLLVGVILLLAAFATTRAAQLRSIAPTSGGTGFYLRDALVFQQDNSYTGTGCSYGGGGSIWCMEKAGFVAPVTLPHGVTITKFTFYYEDMNDTERVTASLWRMLVMGYEGTPRPLASVESGGLPNTQGVASLEDVTIDNPVVDAESYTYFIDVGLAKWTKIRAFRIDYTYPTYLPAVSR